jgi:hypothetical protein
MAGRGDESRDRRSSDAPADLLQEREAFVRSFLRRGVELTEELLRENTELRDQLAELQVDNARLSAAVRSDDAIRDLLTTIEVLEAEKKDLLVRTERMRDSGIEGAHREEVEQELNDLANLYVAGAQLQTTLSPRRILRHLSDTVGQLVGARRFVIYVVDPARGQVVPIAQDSLHGPLPDPIPLGDGVVGQACLTGIARVSADPSTGSWERPAAVLPLMADGRAVGAVVVATLLQQKTSWARVDHELFKLLGAQAGVALITANLYAQTDNALNALQGFADRVRAAESE